MAGQEVRGEDGEAGGEFAPWMGHLAVGTEPISQGNWAAMPIFPAVVWGISCSTQECPWQEEFGAIHQTLFNASAMGQLLALHPHLFLNPTQRREERLF